MKQLWKFRPLDTLFFRDSTPFEAGTVDRVQPESRFPPFMSSLQGAIRTSLAIQQGWEPNQKTGFPKELGDAENIGQLSLQGPYLEWEDEILYPLPRVLFGQIKDIPEKKRKWNLHRLIPGTPVDTDLGESLRLLVPDSHLANGKALELWGTKEALEAVLQGDLPEIRHLKVSHDLWTHEAREGIKMDSRNKRVERGHLYSSLHIRVRQGLKILVWVDGIPDAWKTKKRFATALGGEGRFADVEVVQEREEPPTFPELKRDASGKICYTLSLLTPGEWPPEEMKKVMEKGPSGAPGQCISASIGKVWRRGGWNLADWKPRPLKPLLPPGTTWFYVADPADEKKIYEWHWKKHVGVAQEQGMGQLVVGTWKEREDGT